MSSAWRCVVHGTVEPFRVAHQLEQDVFSAISGKSGVPVWLPWPLPMSWTVTGLGWAGDERRPAAATVTACSGPAPLGGPGDVLLVAEEPGVGLGAWLSGVGGLDPGPILSDELSDAAPAQVIAAGHPTRLWSVHTGADRCAFVGEARGMWLWAIARPAAAAYVFAEDLVLCDLREDLPTPLPFGAPTPYLRKV